MKNTETEITEAEIAEILEAEIAEYQAMEKEMVDTFNSLSEEMQQQFIEYMRELIPDGIDEQAASV